jgi:hypothetical protein
MPNVDARRDELEVRGIGKKMGGAALTNNAAQSTQVAHRKDI